MDAINNEQIRLTRYYTYAQFEEVFLEVVKLLPPNFYTFSFLGSSVQNRSIYGLKLGHGPYKILAWSQMHGNESTTTRALLDLIQSPDLFTLLKGKSLYIIPVLNPDGAEAWTRNNANNVDLNRDALDLSQPESQLFRDTLDFYEPDLALNLHGQRSIYGVEANSLPCQLSFLAPAADAIKSITSSRLTSMHLINKIVSALQLKMTAVIGRYDDSFNQNCYGDYCQSQNIPTLLFEAGHAQDDYSRDVATGLILEGLKTVLLNAEDHLDLDPNEVRSAYESISPVSKCYVDILIRNVPAVNGRNQLAIMYHEQVTKGQLELVPMLYSINEASILYGHRTIDLNDHSSYQDDLIIHDNLFITSHSLKISSIIK